MPTGIAHRIILSLTWLGASRNNKGILPRMAPHLRRNPASSSIMRLPSSLRWLMSNSHRRRHNPSSSSSRLQPPLRHLLRASASARHLLNRSRILPLPTPSSILSSSIPSNTTPTDDNSAANPPPAKKSRTNTPWSPAEELRLKQMRDAGNSWAEIAKTFPTRTEGSVKKHWYKDMHYAEFAEDEALLNAIKEYENNKWKTIGQKVGKPAKACEQYAKEHFPDLFSTPKPR
ncbi:hypothetical protein BR93DRAFT_223949 [Coniochaeta sp. PMI_546]|nr:hypothetical protein BR93DRAFT_223949 [Coniochaeta sp. PMI_546]